ncbi:glycosyltransferase family 2 protein [Actinoplanes sp. RD1]|uniref:glycosyltransferase family 2 protein n=1 Tax=Actinoplanes sp. RD1 TaxID=3064538 RepID=UPI00274221D2|nr:glycosyltransferase [Actinoplanes sp. RD1]
MTVSVLIPAFNEETGIGIALRRLAGSQVREIVVAANGCTDRTAETARELGARVVEIATPSKSAALTAADRVATGDVRVYLDADVPASPELIRRLAEAVARPGIEAAVPRPVVDATGSTWPVRAYYAVNSRLPVFRGRLFGRGVIALSAAARARFTDFPPLTADDMFLDAVVAPGEKTEIDVPVRVVAPRTAGDLIRRVARARDGNDEFRRYLATSPFRAAAAPDNTSWLRDVVLRRPWLAPAAVVYVAVVLLAERKRRSPSWDVRSGWGRPAIPRQRRSDDSLAKRP